MSTSRPLSVTLVAAFVFVFGTLSLAIELFVLASPETYRMFLELADAAESEASVQLSTSFHLVHGILGSVVWIISGIFMLRGKNWARWLILAWGLTALALTSIVSRLSLWLFLKTATYLLMLFFLCRQRASSFFSAPPISGDDQL